MFKSLISKRGNLFSLNGNIFFPFAAVLMLALIFPVSNSSASSLLLPEDTLSRLDTVGLKEDSLDLGQLYRSDFRKFLRVFSDQSTQAGKEDFKKRKIYLKQTHLVEQLKNHALASESDLKEYPKILDLGMELEKSRVLLDQLLDSASQFQTHVPSERNLMVTSSVLGELEKKISKAKQKVDTYADRLRFSQYMLDSINSHEELYQFPSDSMEAKAYFNRLLEIANEIGPIAERLTVNLKAVDSMQVSINALLFEVRENLTLQRNYSANLNSGILKREIKEESTDLFWNGSFKQGYALSFYKEKAAFFMYLQLYRWRIILAVILTFIFALFLRNLKKKINNDADSPSLSEKENVLSHITLSSLVIAPSILQFIFPMPPFSFYLMIWIVSAVSLSLYFIGYLNKVWLYFWIVMTLVMILTGLFSMNLIPHHKEVPLIIILASLGVLIAIAIPAFGFHKLLKEKRIVYFIALMGIFEAISIILILGGRYNLSKSFLFAGYMGVVVGILLLWSVRLLNQALTISSKIYHHYSKNLFFINFERVGSQAPAIVYKLLVVGWAVLLGKNFYFFSEIYSAINDFLVETRTVGSYTFSIKGIFIFVVILLAAALISKTLSLFTTEPEVTHNPEERKKVSLSSWLSLAQVFVICLGLFLAFAASGIPLDKITIILGALSVGIGLGLQSLVANLVSGFIIAFENPVQAGDLIEIDGKPGTMKSIGIRSSIVSMFEGSTVVIPNSDLISKQLINWTTGKGRKLDFTVGVAYGSDIDLVLEVVFDLIREDSRIKSYPNPRVAPKEFSSSSIDIQIICWIGNYFDYVPTKGDLINKIHKAFRLKGIHIPFPQQDVYIKAKEKSTKYIPDPTDKKKSEGI
ncbi:small-conductance mechanosensitive channel [Algoriphagus iocasae]|uniref:Small-conductance mechanosensitive channel n=1 Tax=Algoriphagus iocasae TaxID=1836499 RepID=A0A841MLD3_9BACT|nr:mechanosensitive ion channel domain-containing protein [Algoriphagus iocasae]MBB6328250.1 small-conductance mechanosensitive channel [Algoriphagus iocasae]